MSAQQFSCEQAKTSSCCVDISRHRRCIPPGFTAVVTPRTPPFLLLLTPLSTQLLSPVFLTDYYLHYSSLLQALFKPSLHLEEEQQQQQQQLTGADPPADQFPQHAGRQTNRQTVRRSSSPLWSSHLSPSWEREKGRKEGSHNASLPPPLSGSMCFDTIRPLRLRPLLHFSKHTHAARSRVEEVEGEK